MFRYYLYANTIINKVSRIITTLIKGILKCISSNSNCIFSYKTEVEALFNEYKELIREGKFSKSISIRTIIDEKYRLNRFTNKKMTDKKC